MHALRVGTAWYGWIFKHGTVRFSMGMAWNIGVVTLKNFTCLKLSEEYQDGTTDLKVEVLSRNDAS
jgi:hypothetical protein